MLPSVVHSHQKNWDGGAPSGCRGRGPPAGDHVAVELRRRQVPRQACRRGADRAECKQATTAARLIYLHDRRIRAHSAYPGRSIGRDPCRTLFSNF
jgi:hypothetical protein